MTLMNRNSTIAQITLLYGLDKRLKMNRNKHHTPYQLTKIYGDIFESLICAYWIDRKPTGGLNVTRKLIEPICLWMKDELKKGNLWSRRYPHP